MPKRQDIESILILGAGPIIIGQACEFDYSGTQACRALEQEGYRVILVNSNPATIMTDPDIANSIYIEPVQWQSIEKVIAREKPDAILPTMGGQTGLNTALDLARKGILDKYNVEMIGATKESIDTAEDRELFKVAMEEIGIEVAQSGLAHNLEESFEIVRQIGYPIIIRPSFTLGGSGGGVANDEKEFITIVERGLKLSPTNEVLLEESLLGWKEFEMEVVRDRNDNSIIVCSIENLDPMGIHTGDSITVAPAQTLTDKELQKMRDNSIAILRRIGVDTGGSNVQFAVNPQDGRMIVIEMNPRLWCSHELLLLNNINLIRLCTDEYYGNAPSSPTNFVEKLGSKEWYSVLYNIKKRRISLNNNTEYFMLFRDNYLMQTLANFFLIIKLVYYKAINH